MSLCGCLLSAWVLASISVNIQAVEPRFAHVRSADRSMLNLLGEGYRNSPTLRKLVDLLDASNVIVYVEPGICAFGHLGGCLLAYIEVAPSAERYLRVAITLRQDPRRILSVVAHELQHAREVAEAPDVTTVDEMLRLFQRIGRAPACPPAVRACYETSAAVRTGLTVLNELSAAGVK